MINLRGNFRSVGVRTTTEPDKAINLVFYTNCQNRGLSYFIRKYIKEIETKHIENYRLIKDKRQIPIDILKQADIFIYQPIDKKHGIYSTDTSVENNIMSFLSPNCKTISFPYIYNPSLWVLLPPAHIDGYIGSYLHMDKYVNREPIEKLKIKGYSLDEVLQMYSKGLIDFDYENRFVKSIEILKKKEELCDVKVSDFIEKNIKKHKLFFTQNHPTTCVFIHCVNQILYILGYDYKFDEFSYPENICNLPGEWPHTSYDIKYWNFEYKNNNINNNWYVEHIKNIYNNFEYLFPLSYSIPLKFVKNAKEIKKTRLFSPLIPGDKKTYIYKNEISYNKNYSESYFSFTFKKGGYDCLRHYEILANNSIPYYIDIDKIPNKTMTTFPKSIVKNAMKSLHNKDNVQIFDKYIQDLNEYTINNLTCEKTAHNFIKLINNLNNKNSQKNVLMLSDTGVDYSMMTLAYGLRQNLKDNFIDFPKINSLYTKQQFNLHLEDDMEIDRKNVSDKIKNKLYDYIILGPIGPDENWVNQPMFKKYEELILSSYKKTEIIYIFGGDRPFNIKQSNMFNNYLRTYMQKGICFVRELDNNTEYYHDNTWRNYVTECELEWNKKIKSAYSIINSIKDTS